MYTLYYKPGACSMAVHVLLNELKQSCELVPFKNEAGELNPNLKKINPRGMVPTLEKGDFHMMEGGAILSWLCDEHASELLPKSGEARAQALQWLMFANASLHPAYGQIFFLKAQTIDQKAKDMLMTAICEKIQKLWDIAESELEGKDYICGSTMCVADILMTVIANWSPNLPNQIRFGKNCKALFKRVSERPAYQQALIKEDVTYKVAA